MKSLFCFALAVLCAVTAAGAQHMAPPGGPGRHHPGEMMEGRLAEFGLFPPDFVLANQNALGLSDRQLLAITKDVGATHEKFAGMRDTIRPLAEKLHAMLSQSRIDEPEALALAAQVHDLEKQIKMEHLGLMIRVKNTLTPDQQEKLKSLAPPRPERADRPGRPAPPMPPSPDDSE